MTDFDPEGTFDLALSREVDRARLQLEAAEAAGDTASADAFRQVLANLEARIPEREPADRRPAA